MAEELFQTLLQKASGIGPPKGPETPLPTPREEQDPIMKLLNLSGMINPIEQAEGPLRAVAGVSPEKIPALKEAGKALLDRVKREGVENRSFGFQATQKDPWNWFRKLFREPEREFPKPNVPLTPEYIEALEYAQQRYPRYYQC
jgi:hypothetical protein